MKKKNWNFLAANIRNRREALGLKPTVVAEQLDLTLRAYQNIENGQTSVTIERLLQIADILHTKVAILVEPDMNLDNCPIRTMDCNQSPTASLPPESVAEILNRLNETHSNIATALEQLLQKLE